MRLSIRGGSRCFTATVVPQQKEASIDISWTGSEITAILVEHFCSLLVITRMQAVFSSWTIDSHLRKMRASAMGVKGLLLNNIGNEKEHIIP